MLCTLCMQAAEEAEFSYAISAARRSEKRRVHIFVRLLVYIGCTSLHAMLMGSVSDMVAALTPSNTMVCMLERCGVGSGGGASTHLWCPETTQDPAAVALVGELHNLNRSPCKLHCPACVRAANTGALTPMCADGDGRPVSASGWREHQQRSQRHACQGRAGQRRRRDGADHHTVG